MLYMLGCCAYEEQYSKVAIVSKKNLHLILYLTLMNMLRLWLAICKVVRSIPSKFDNIFSIISG